jgi:acyl-CoA thioesterase FadM
VIEVSAEAMELDEKRTEVKAAMRYGDTITAKAEATFVRVDRAKFGFD